MPMISPSPRQRPLAFTLLCIAALTTLGLAELAARPRCGVHEGNSSHQITSLGSGTTARVFSETGRVTATHDHYRGVQRVLVIRVDFADRAGASVTREAAQAVLDNEVAPFFAKSSYGATSLVSTVTEKVYRMPHTSAEYANGKNLDPSDCNSEWVAKLHEEAIAAASLDHAAVNFDRIIVALPAITEGANFEWAGLADYSGKRVWINGNFVFSVVAHELGHTYGGQHSATWAGTATDPIAANGRSDPYGDQTDIMGSGTTSAHDFSPYNKWAMGWLPDSAITDVRVTGRYRIYPSDGAVSSTDRPVSLRISRDGMRDYWVSLRCNATGDASLKNGAHVAWTYHANQNSRTLDLKAPYDRDDEIGLSVGAALEDPSAGISIRVAAQGGAGADSYLDIDVVCRRLGETLAVAWGATQSYDTAQMTGVRDVVAVAAGEFHSLALRSDGTVWTGGRTNGHGEDQVPVGLNDAVYIAAGRFVSGAIRRDGSVVVWGDPSNGLTTPPPAANPAIALAFGDKHALALRRDGTVVAWGADGTDGQAKVPADLRDVIAIAAGGYASVALKRDGTIVGWGINSHYVPKNVTDVVAIACNTNAGMAARRDGSVVAWGHPNAWELAVPPEATDVVSIAAGSSRFVALRSDGSVVAWSGHVTILNGVPPVHDTSLEPPRAIGRIRSISTGAFHTLAVTDDPYAAAPKGVRVAAGSAELATEIAPGSEVRWERNGLSLPNATSARISLGSMPPALAGLYVAEVSNTAGSTVTRAAVVGASTVSKVTGDGEEVTCNAEHPSGRIYDQVLATGDAEAITADHALGQITRTSFIDVDGDIVQVEFAGPGTLSLVLEGAGSRAAPEKYHQPTVPYVKGHAGIVIVDADERTNVSVFSVGRATAFDRTGGFNIVEPISATNNPANNGSDLFKGVTTSNNGVADVAFIAISSRTGKFGGVRTANTAYFATRGFTGLYAPGVQFTGPVYLGDIIANDSAKPVLILGSALAATGITGGDMLQPNGQAVEVSGITRLEFRDGQDSHGRLFAAQRNRAVFKQNGKDVTSQVVVNPQ